MLTARSGRPGPDADRLFGTVTSEADMIYKTLPSWLP